ncbi:unnamed protein product [Brassica oleracea]
MSLACPTYIEDIGNLTNGRKASFRFQKVHRSCNSHADNLELEKIAKGIWCKLMFSKEENMREDQYVNVLEHQQKQKFLEWMKNQSELAGNVACSSISRFVWHTMSKTWKPKYDNEDECSLLIQFI